MRRILLVAALASAAAAVAGGVVLLTRDDSAAIGDHGVVPALDRSQHSVPLDQIVFDTFDGRYVPLTDATDALVERLLDAIPPLDDPVYAPAADVPWLTDETVVLGLDLGGEARAFPISYLDRHEIVNDEIGGRAVVVTWCPLCQTAVVFTRELDGRTLSFSNTSALHESDLVMVDRQTGSYWFHAAGEAIVGALTGSRLDVLPSVTATWGEWRRLNPDTEVLVGDAASAFEPPRPSSVTAGIPEAADEGRFAFPVERGLADGRLRAGEPVLAVETDGGAKGYPLRLLRNAVVNDTVGVAPVLVAESARGGLAVAYAALIDGRRLTFERHGEGLRDRETRTTWDLAGRALDGKLAGAELEALPSRRGLWFALSLALPGLELYRTDEAAEPAVPARNEPYRPTREQRLGKLVEQP